MSKLSLIVAMDKNGLIGKDNSLPWSLPEDLKYFRKTTTGHSIVMGRKTFESLGRPLPNRTNIVLTRDHNFQAEGCLVVTDIQEVLQICENEEVFIIGGKQVYELFFPYVDKLYITKIEEEFTGDTNLLLDLTNFTRTKNEKHFKDEKNPHDFRFQIFERN